MDKLLPVFLLACGERTGTAIDNLNLAQRLRFAQASRRLACHAQTPQPLGA